MYKGMKLMEGKLDVNFCEIIEVERCHLARGEYCTNLSYQK